MAKGKRCPVCGHFTYREWKGNHDTEKWGEGRKLNPDYGRCSYCGFVYVEDVRYSFERQVEAYKRFFRRRIPGYKIKDCKHRVKRGEGYFCNLRLCIPYIYLKHPQCPFPSEANSINCPDFKPKRRKK